LQRLRLILLGDGTYDGLTHDVAVPIHYIGGGEGEDVGGKGSRRAAGIEIHVLIGGALLGQHVLRVGDGRLVAVQRKGVDADERAALVRQLLVQRVQLAKLTHAGAAGGKPEIHHGDGVGGEQLVAFDLVAVQILALKGGEFLHIAVGVGLLIQNFGMLLFQLGQLILDLADLLRGLLQQRVFLIAELVLGGFDGVQ